MPSYVIHTAIAEVYVKRHPEEERESFMKGVIAPDLLPKPQSHFGPASSQPDLELCKATMGLSDSYSRGYFLHLLSDKLFFDVFLSAFSKELYHDYDKVNADLIERYGVRLLPETVGTVAFADGEPTLFDREALYRFIDAVGEVDLFAEYEATAASVREKQQGG